LISQRTPNISTNYFISDGHGSTRMLADIGGTVINVMVYDSYGNLIASNGTLQTAYLYSGQQFDSDLELYYNRARYLNTGTGRFWTMDGDYGSQEDPLSLHKYLYAEDNPVDGSDPSGNDDLISLSVGESLDAGLDALEGVGDLGVEATEEETLAASEAMETE
jgi:RHS repeat-associated protein